MSIKSDYSRVFDNLISQNMPKPHDIITISWEDVLEHAIKACKKRHDRDPTRAEVIEIFNSAARRDDIYMDDFWMTIENAAAGTYGK